MGENESTQEKNRLKKRGKKKNRGIDNMKKINQAWAKGKRVKLRRVEDQRGKKTKRPKKEKVLTPIQDIRCKRSTARWV